MEIINSIDDLKIYRGKDIVINQYITIKQPTINDITDYGEKEYYDMVYTLCSVGADLKWQLDDIHIDYTEISDFDLFCSFLSKQFNKEQTKILFGEVVDFQKMKIEFNEDIQESVLIQYLDNNDYIQIDRYVYTSIVSILRKMHGIKRNDEIPGNEETKRILIEDAREEHEENKGKQRKSVLMPLVSALVNSSGFKRDDESVFNMKIFAFMDSVARINKIKMADLLLTSGYSGFGIDLKKLNNDDTNWLGELN